MARDMNSKYNSIEAIKERYQKGIIEAYRIFLETSESVRDARRIFNKMQYDICSDGNIQTPRWEIVGRKNFFGLAAEIGPNRPYIDYKNKKRVEASEKSIFLKVNAGRFRIESQPVEFANMVDISDVLQRSEEEQFIELEEFWNMNNRQLFERFGVQARQEDSRKLVANCIVLDSLLKDKYSELKDVFCHNKGRTND